MERRLRNWAGCGLAMLLATAAGCQHLHSSVPAGPKFSPDGRQQPSVGFSTDPHPMNQSGNPALNPIMNAAPGGGMAGSSGMPQVGTPGVGSNPYGTPPGASFGQPGTSGAAPGLGGPAGGAGGLPAGMPGSN